MVAGTQMIAVLALLVHRDVCGLMVVKVAGQRGVIVWTWVIVWKMLS